jgi:hypothetical protein
MLRVGLLPGQSMATVRGRLLELGAVSEEDLTAPRSLDEPGIVLAPAPDGKRDLSLPHLVVGAVPSTAGDPTAAGKRADVPIAEWSSDRMLVGGVDEV